MKIYNTDNSVLHDVIVTQDAKHEQELMKGDFVSLKWSDVDCYTIPTGAYIIPFADGVHYTLFGDCIPTQKDEVEYIYEPHFQHPKMILAHTPCMLATKNIENKDIKDTDWTYVGGLSTLLDYIVKIITEEIGMEFKYYILNDNDADDNVSDIPASASCSFSGVDILSAFTEICNQFNCEYYIDWNNAYIYIGHVKRDLATSTPVLEVGYNINVPSVSRNNKEVANYFIVRGGTRNITTKTASGDNVETDTRLSIADISIKRDSAAPKLVKTLIFDNVYPKLDLYVHDVRKRIRRLTSKQDGNYVIDKYDNEGNPIYKKYAVYYIRLAYKTAKGFVDFVDAKKENIVNGKKLMASFEPNEGNGHSALAGREFEMIFHEKPQVISKNDAIEDSGVNIKGGDFEICLEQEGDLIIPNFDTLEPWGTTDANDVCDKVVLFNIVMSDTYLTAAKVELANKANREIKKLLADNNIYTVKSNPVSYDLNLYLGQHVILRTLEGKDIDSRITKIVTQLDIPSQVELTIGSDILKGATQTLREDIKTISSKIGIISNSNSVSSASLQQLLRAWQDTEERLLHKNRDDETPFDITAKNITAKKDAEGNGGNANIEGSANIGGDANVNADLNVGGSSVVEGDSDVHGSFHAWDEAYFHKDAQFDENVNVNKKITTKDLEVTGEAHFFSLVIDEVKSVGGRIILSPASMEVFSVDNQEEGVFRLYERNEGNSKATVNQFRVGDFIICQTFNIGAGQHTNVSNTFYRSVVTAVGTEEMNDAAGNAVSCFYIDILQDPSAYCEKGYNYGTVAPKEGDKIVSLGHIDERDEEGNIDTSRQSAIVLSAYNDGYLDPEMLAPSFAQYDNINIIGNLKPYRRNYIAKNGSKFVGDFSITSEIQQTINNAIHAPYIGPDGYWYVWNAESGEYEKRDKAQGEDGVGIKNVTNYYKESDVKPSTPSVDIRRTIDFVNATYQEDGKPTQGAYGYGTGDFDGLQFQVSGNGSFMLYDNGYVKGLRNGGAGTRTLEINLLTQNKDVVLNGYNFTQDDITVEGGGIINKSDASIVIRPNTSTIQLTFPRYVSSSHSAILTSISMYKYGIINNAITGEGWSTTLPVNTTSKVWQIVFTEKTDGTYFFSAISECPHDGKDAIQVEIFSDKGNIIRNGVGELVLQAVVMRGGVDITNTLYDWQFQWTRKSYDEDSDAVWNEQHNGVGRTIAVTAAEIFTNATFDCFIINS